MHALLDRGGRAPLQRAGLRVHGPVVGQRPAHAVDARESPERTPVGGFTSNRCSLASHALRVAARFHPKTRRTPA
jgi:hypothetical protein